MNQPSRHRTGYVAVRWLMTLFGATLVILGVVTFWLPLPVGLPLLLLGGLTLVRHSPSVRQAVAGATRRYPAFRRFFRRTRILQRRLGSRLAGCGTRRPASPPESD